jgi:nucleotide-binding universal stress UspA family protein
MESSGMSAHPEPSRGKIVVGVDGSPSSQQALRWAARQARLTGEELHAVSVWDYPATAGDFPTAVGWAHAMENIDWSGNASKALDDAITASLDPDDADRVQRSVVQGYPARALLDAAADANLLVVGSRGRGGVVGLLLGSVSQHAVTNACCPVVVVRGEPSTPK